MDDILSSNLTQWESQYHVIFIPKYHCKDLRDEIHLDLGPVFAELARRKECVIETGRLIPDHVHLLIRIPPKYSVSQVVG